MSDKSQTAIEPVIAGWLDAYAKWFPGATMVGETSVNDAFRAGYIAHESLKTPASNDAYYLSLAVNLLTDVLAHPQNANDPGWQGAAEAAVLGTQTWMDANVQ